MSRGLAGPFRRAIAYVAGLVIGSGVANGSSCLAFETPTHEAINLAAARRSASFFGYARTHLGFFRAGDEELQGHTVAGWVGFGGVAEDQFHGFERLGGLTRSARHFHTPRLPWDQAGLDIALLPRFESSIYWAQRADQGLMGQAAWRHGRQAFFEAAIGATEAARHVRFADAFRIVGQIMHLVADLAQPAHTRNDAHILDDDFESFMKATPNAALIDGFRAFDPGILTTPTGDPRAPLPIAHAWDTNTYDGSNPPDDLSSAAFGLSEFTSANFFSPDTTSPIAYADPVLPLPALNLLDRASTEPYLTGELRPYRGKSGYGVPVRRMVAEGTFYRFLPPFISNVTLDDLVFREYATHLLPRAIGYAAGVLDYFFRGRIEIAPPARFAYGLAAYRPGNAGSFTKLRLKVRNATPGEQAGPGQLWAVAQYRVPSEGDNLIDNPAADISTTLSFSVSSRIDLAQLTDGFQELAFDFGAMPIPANSADVFLTVVYRGPLGLEEDAVMVGGRDLFEPDPIDVANISDWECVGGGVYPVSNYPPYAPPTHTERDVSWPPDGVPDLFGPVLIRGQLLKTFDGAGPAPVVSEANFDLAIDELGAAEHGRVMLLQDRATYGAIVLGREIHVLPSGGVQRNTVFTAPLSGMVNNVTLNSAGKVVRRVVAPSVYRGVAGQHMFFLVTPGTVPCIPQTLDRGPSLTRVDGIVADE